MRNERLRCSPHGGFELHEGDGGDYKEANWKELKARMEENV